MKKVFKIVHIGILLVFITSCATKQKLFYSTKFGKTLQYKVRNTFTVNKKFDTIYTNSNATIEKLNDFKYTVTPNEEKSIELIGLKNSEKDTLKFYVRDFGENYMVFQVNFYAKRNRRDQIASFSSGISKVSLEEITKMQSFLFRSSFYRFDFECLIKNQKTQFDIRVISDGKSTSFRTFSFLKRHSFKKGDIIFFENIRVRTECIPDKVYKAHPIIIEVI